jgi:hypothetical protein
MNIHEAIDECSERIESIDKTVRIEKTKHDKTIYRGQDSTRYANERIDCLNRELDFYETVKENLTALAGFIRILNQNMQENTHE